MRHDAPQSRLNLLEGLWWLYASEHTLAILMLPLRKDYERLKDSTAGPCRPSPLRVVLPTAILSQQLQRRAFGERLFIPRTRCTLPVGRIECGERKHAGVDRFDASRLHLHVDAINTWPNGRILTGSAVGRSFGTFASSFRLSQLQRTHVP